MSCRPGVPSAGPGSCSGSSLCWPIFPSSCSSVPVTVLFLGIVADPEETHAVWYGMLNTLGIFDVSTLTDAENVNYAQKKHYFWFGEVGMAGILAGSIAVPAGIWFAGQTEISLAFIGAAVLFLPLFVFMPKLIQRAYEGGYGCSHRCVWEE